MPSVSFAPPPFHPELKIAPSPTFDNFPTSLWSDCIGPISITDCVVLFAGSAFLGGICGQSRVSVVEDRGHFRSALTTAHELGHRSGQSYIYAYPTNAETSDVRNT